LEALRPADVAEGDLWLTLFLVLLLRTAFAADSKKWILIEKKAVNWLEKGGVNVKNQQHL
jgi:hypothetical protein